MADYKLPVIAGGMIIRTADDAAIPPDPANTDYQEFLAWQAAGGVPEPAPAFEPAAPPTVAEKLAAIGLTKEELLAHLSE